jgi:hypothetical protein
MSHLLDSRGGMSRGHFAPAFLFALLVVFAVHALDFPGSVPDFVRASGGGTLLDTRPSFSETAIYERLAAYGDAGRANYAFRNVTVDVLLPLSLFPFLSLLAWRAGERLSLGRGARALLLALPLVYVVFDLAENGSALVLLRSFPDRVPFAAAVLPYLTVLKRVGLLLALTIPPSLFGISFIQSKLATRSMRSKSPVRTG